MYNYLRGRLRQLGYRDKDLCPILKVNPTGVSHRMTNKTPWSIDEMYLLLDLCRDTPDKLHLYFPRGGIDHNLRPAIRGAKVNNIDERRNGYDTSAQKQNPQPAQT